PAGHGRSAAEDPHRSGRSGEQDEVSLSTWWGMLQLANRAKLGHSELRPDAQERPRGYPLPPYATCGIVFTLCDGPSAPLPCWRWPASWHVRPASAWRAITLIRSVRSPPRT